MGPDNYQPLKNSFVDFGDYVQTQLSIPLGQLSFWAFLVLAILGAGGYGVWVELYRWNSGITHDLSGVVLAFFTYYPALVGASIVQLIFHDQKYVRSGFFFIGVLIFLITFFCFPASGEASKVDLVLGSVLSIVSIIIWWIANGNEAFLHDHPAPSASTGGDVNGELNGTVPAHQAPHRK